MIITRAQAQLLADLSGQIQDKYGLIIGYTNPEFPASPAREVDFIIFENREGAGEEETTLHCFHKDDIQIKPMGQHMVRVLPAQPEHDEQVEKLIDRINNDLLDGVIWFDPGVTREIDGLKIEVTKKTFPGTDENVFNTNIFTQRYGTVYTYEFITEAALHDKRFRVAKEIIDEEWPREEIAEEATESFVGAIVRRLLRLFGF